MKKLCTLILSFGLIFIISVSACADAADKLYKDIEPGMSVAAAISSQSKLEFNYGVDEQLLYQISYQMPSTFQLGAEYKFFQDYIAALSLTENSNGLTIALGCQDKYRISEQSLLLKGKCEYGIFIGNNSANPNYSLLTLGAGLEYKFNELFSADIGYLWYDQRALGVLNTNDCTGNIFLGAGYQLNRYKFFVDYNFSNSMSSDLFEVGVKYYF